MKVLCLVLKIGRFLSWTPFLHIFFPSLWQESAKVIDFGFQDCGSQPSIISCRLMSTLCFIATYDSIHLGWLGSSGWISEAQPLFLQTLHHFMNIWRSQGKCSWRNISFSWWQKGWINVDTPVSWEGSQNRWFKSSACADAARGLSCINYYGNHALK